MLLGNSDIPSSRLRWYNYLSELKERGFDFIVLKNNGFAGRLLQFTNIEKKSLIIIQKKLLTFIELVILKFRKCRLIFDIDDAVWLTHPISEQIIISPLKRLFKRVFKLNNLRLYSLIICANTFLADHLKPYNHNICVIPTSPSDDEIETSKNRIDGLFYLVWTGIKSNFHYLNAVETQIVRFLNENPDTRFRVISDGEYLPNGLNNPNQIVNVKWSIIEESRSIQQSDIGLMPLTLDDWSAGKSALKILKYMKLRIPVIATDYGYQKTIISNGENGFLVNNESWYEKLTEIYNNSNKLDAIIESGFSVYQQSYAKSVILNLYDNIIRIEANLEYKRHD